MSEIVSEWTPEELPLQPRCYCDCHTHPGMYPTTEQRPCRACGHVNEFGYMPGSVREGWVKYCRATDSGAKLWCIVRIENKACFTGYSEERFRAIDFTIGEDHLIFSLPFGGRKIFNWHKVLWLDASPIEEAEVQP